MHFIKPLVSGLTLATVVCFMSCTKDKTTTSPNELEGLSSAAAMSNDSHNIALYTANGKFQMGYNEVYFQIKNTDGSLVSNTATTATSWVPMMNMTSMNMKHSCPFSPITKKENAQSTYSGYVVFTMAGSDTDYWELTLKYTIKGVEYSASGKVSVVAAPKRVVNSFKGSDGKRYVLAMVEPKAPTMGANDMTCILYTMESMTSFLPVDGYTIKIDPRMPSMGNHNSPNNVDLTQKESGMYHGKVNFTMTGSWKINLILEDASQKALKGEPISDGVESSSLYFEVEF